MLGRFNERIYLNSVLISTPVESSSSPVHTFAYLSCSCPLIRSFNLCIFLLLEIDFDKVLRFYLTSPHQILACCC